HPARRETAGAHVAIGSHVVDAQPIGGLMQRNDGIGAVAGGHSALKYRAHRFGAHAEPSRANAHRATSTSPKFRRCPTTTYRTESQNCRRQPIHGPLGEPGPRLVTVSLTLRAESEVDLEPRIWDGGLSGRASPLRPDLP